MLIEGWRGIGHSYCLVNQWQILELLKFANLSLFHRDVPYANEGWNRESIPAGFDTAAQASIDALADAPYEAVDSIFRIAWPFRTDPVPAGKRVLTFLVTEFGLTKSSFGAGFAPEHITRDGGLIITPSQWARQRIVEFGFPADQVHVVAHGVDPHTFYRLSEAERLTSRQALGFAEDDFLFLNLGAAIWNKGIDALVLAFATLRRAGRKARLILKETPNLYNRPTLQAIQEVAAKHPELFNDDVVASIHFIPNSVNLAQLNRLYNVADCYVSAYRAEGFNLPVLEAIACGTPVIVTAGGATDDFCSRDVGLQIGGVAGMIGQGEPLRYVEPNHGELVAAMEAFVAGQALDMRTFAAGRRTVLDRFTWKAAAEALVNLAQNTTPNQQHSPGILAAVRSIQEGQRQVLGLLDMLRPLAMAKNAKCRVGNIYDGGYVLPECVRDCDAVLSIGVGSDVTFDLELAKAGARVLQFDHTVPRTPQTHPNFTFYKKGWGERTEGDLLSFTDINALLDGLQPKRAMLKFDIEGYEYNTIPQMPAEQLARFEVIACELHDFDKITSPEVFQRIQATLAKLTTYHVPVHMHVNNYAGMTLISGVPIPAVIEVSFLRKDMDEFPDFSTDSIPGPLDNPNNPTLPDICLTPFGKAGRRCLHIYCDGGLGNRWNALMSGLAVAKAAGLEPIVVWPVNNWCGAKYSDLFDRPLRVIEKELAAFTSTRHNFQYLLVEDRLGLASATLSPMAFPDMFTLVDHITRDTRDVFYYTALIPPMVSATALKEQIVATPFRQDLARRVNDFMTENGLKDFYGVQIRKTDFGANGANLDAVRHMITLNPGQRFFVCSDDKTVEAEFSQFDNVITLPKNAYVEKLVEGDWNAMITDSSGRVYACNVNRNAESVREAVLDLLVLSRSSIIRTSGSTFLSMAQYIQNSY